jgi:formyl-CoA transferase
MSDISALPQPLEGVTVIDLTQIMAGPFCTLLLADMGATVVKVEKPNGGDDTRRMGPPFINGESAAFLGVNRNKRSIVINLKNKKGIDLVKQMVKKADVLVQNFRPGTLNKMGLGYDDLNKINQSLIYCSISGFGNTGPYKDRGGFDLVTQGMSGLMSITGESEANPTKIGVPITDLNSGMYATYGILNAYIHMLKTGSGQHVDVSLIESGIAYTFWEAAEYFATGNIPKPQGSAHRLNAPYQAFKTSDGHVNIGAANQNNWEKLCKAIKKEELINNLKFTNNSERMANKDELVQILEDCFKNNTTNYWVDLLSENGVPSGPILNIKEVFEDPHVKERNMIIETNHPIAGIISNIGIPVKLSLSPGSIKTAAPVLGQHTREVLTEFSFSEKEIETLISSEVVMQN